MAILAGIMPTTFSPPSSEWESGIGKTPKSTSPPIGTGLLDGNLAWRQHEGGHTDAPNMAYFIKWADAKMGRPGQ